LWKLK
jgi:hypothetical protein